MNRVALYIEALDSNGKWTRVVDDMGFPAGLPRTTVADLTGKFAPGTRRLRITTNLQIYWDQILVDTTLEQPEEIKVTDVPLAHAQLGFHGYPRMSEYPYSKESPPQDNVHLNDLLNYDIRFSSGAPSTSYRFRYPRRAP